MNKILWSAALLSLIGAASAEEGYSAKSLFMGTDGQAVAVSTSTPDPMKSAGTTPAKKPVNVASSNRMGASYFIRLKNPNGTTTDVLATRHFKSGERFQLGLRVNRPTYVYIFNEDAGGKVTQLYPQPNQSNRVDAMGIVFLPNQGSFEFDVEPGIEQLTIVLAQSPQEREPQKMRTLQPDLVSDPGTQVASAGCTSAADSMGQPVPSTDPNYAGKGITTRTDAPTCEAQPAYAAKGIVFSDDPAPPSGQQVASYVVKPVTSSEDTLTLKLKLLHR